MYTETNNTLDAALGFHYPLDFLIGETLDLRTHDDQGNLSRDERFCDATRDYFKGLLEIVRDLCEARDEHSPLARSLFGDTVRDFGVDYHRRWPQAAFQPPRFFRTDEPELGKISEIQCPGSQWGELLILAKTIEPTLYDQHITRFGQGLHQLSAAPKIHHLLDNASRPQLMQAFIHCLRSELKVPCYGFDPFHHMEANVVRSHSFNGLAAQNVFARRLHMAEAGKISFDYPATPVFDQKIGMALVFHRQTRHYFSDNTRDHIIPTYLINADLSIEGLDAAKSLDEVFALPRPKRSYYLKYAGQDTNRNWGSMAVRHLSSCSQTMLSELRQGVAVDSATGRSPWILQQDCSSKRTVREYDQDTGELRAPAERYAKYSTFIGPAGLVGRLINFRSVKTVHGQPDTVFCLGR
ncbi:MAG: hypothetical protein KUG77_11960 [Nannocystaceae bacterium]|nr:hypothetical protein [Nannocystaceae bacterium]